MFSFLRLFVRKIIYQIEKIIIGSPNVLKRLETSRRIRDNKMLSIARFGDGEFKLIREKASLGFQCYNGELAERLVQVLKSDLDESKLLVCIPDCFKTVNRMRKQNRGYWIKWVNKYRGFVMKLTSRKSTYGDTNMTRLYLPWVNREHEDEIIDNIRSAWSGKQLVIVEGQKTRFGVGNGLASNAASVSRILCPAENAWSRYNDILAACKELSKDVVFVLALGPTATVLAYDLAKAGYRALDVGHMDLQYEYYLRGAEKKCIIEGKYNNEVIGGSIVADCCDAEYLDSIICEIV